MTRWFNPVIEQASAEQLDAVAGRRLGAQLRRVVGAVPFYAGHLAGVDVGGEWSRERFAAEVPTTSKRELLAAVGDVGVVVGGEGVRGVHLTSGTSGVGREAYPRSAGDLEGVGVGFAYQLHWAGVEPGDRLLLTIPYGLTMAGPFGIKAAELAGVVPVYAGGLGAAEKLDLVERFAVAAIWATPTYLRRLMAVAGERGLRPDRDLPVLKALVISGEPWLTEWAAELEAFWGVPLFEMYGSTQTTGATLLTCERGVLPGGDRGVLHNLDHRVHLEVLDPDTFEAVGVGEQGEAVVTDLVNTGFPCIRFRTGDLVTYLGRAACPCGRALTQLRCGAITRADDRMKIRGVNVWPEAFDAVLLGRFGALEYQGEVSVDERRGTEEVRIRVELPAGAPPLTEIADAVRTDVGVGVRLEAVEPHTLPRYDFKVRRWTDFRRTDRAAVVHHVEGGS